MKFLSLAIVASVVSGLKISSETSTGKWERNKPNLYEGASQVNEWTAGHANFVLKKIESESTDAKLPNNRAQLVEAYHPDCKACKEF